MDRVTTLDPEGKKGVRIAAEKYDRVKGSIIGCLAAEGPMRFDQFAAKVASDLDRFDGSRTWYIETVKLDLEARGVLVHDRKTRLIALNS
jgi:hypothetical protein